MSLLSFITGANEDAQDTPYQIVISDNDVIDLELEDVYRYHDEVELIKNKIKQWMSDEFDSWINMNIPLDRSLPYLLSQLSFTTLALPEAISQLENGLKDNEEYRSGSRWLDTVVSISMCVDTETLETIKGKFLDAVLYQVGRDHRYSSKEEWLAILARFPWLPYLVLLREVWQDDLRQKYSKYLKII